MSSTYGTLGETLPPKVFWEFGVEKVEPLATRSDNREFVDQIFELSTVGIAQRDPGVGLLVSVVAGETLGPGTKADHLDPHLIGSEAPLFH